MNQILTQLVRPPLATYSSLCSTCVTYRTPSHAIGHQLLPTTLYRECYGFERAFFTLRRFLPYTPSCWFQGFRGSRQFNLKVSRASCWSSRHSPGRLLVWITAIHKRDMVIGSIQGLRLAGHVMKNLYLTRFELASRKMDMLKAVCFIRSATDSFSLW